MRISFLLLFILMTVKASGQFSNRYPKVKGYRHHIYLEAYDFPFYSNGPVTPAVSPDGKTIAFSSLGWLWLYDAGTRTATRITRGGDQDFLPAWSPDGTWIAFVRDTRKETSLMLYNTRTGTESKLIDHPSASELDPYFSPDGQHVYYASSAAGTFDIWRVQVATLKAERVTMDDSQQEFRPVPAGNETLYYISKGGGDQIRQQKGSATQVLADGRILSQLWFDKKGADGIVFNWPVGSSWELFEMNAQSPAARLRLHGGRNFDLYPHWSEARKSVVFASADDNHQFNLYEVPGTGGRTAKLEIDRWIWGEATNKLNVSVSQSGKPSPARVSIQMESGHYLIPDEAIAHFDSQQGDVYAYVDGTFSITVPPGRIRIRASHGLLDTFDTGWINPDKPVSISIPSQWKQAGWYAGEHHFHMNYGGPFRLDPEDLVPVLNGEAIDFATPMAANLHLLLKDEEWMDWERNEFPRIRFAQEVRSHFHGHIGLFGNNKLYWPWFWGPLAYEVRTYDDRPNLDVLNFARKSGSVSAYVHPITDTLRFRNDEALAGIPLELVADAVLGSLDALEVACLWSDETGSSMLYHQLLNVGIPMALTAGTDAFPSYGRCSAIGTARVYVKSDQPDWNSYLQALKDGRSFVTTGPMINLTIDGKEPGQTLVSKSTVSFQLEVASANPLEQVEIICNGKMLWKPATSARTGTFTGKLRVPKGGWLAARVTGPKSQWPAMDSYPFAHTAPIWIGQRGSTDPETRRASAAWLRKALEVAYAKMTAGYKGKEYTRQEEVFKQARARLDALAK